MEREFSLNVSKKGPGKIVDIQKLGFIKGQLEEKQLSTNVNFSKVEGVRKIKI